MASVEFKNVYVDFPIYNTPSRSIKNRIMNAATGGQLAANAQGVVVVRALEDINFALKEGDRLGLAGHNGAGKTTLLRLLGGIYEPSHGVVSTKGKVGSLIDISFGIDAESTGRENIYIRGSILGLTKTEINAYLDEIIDFTELGDFIDVPVRTYSTGMHLRLAFAVSTILRPEILVMDEWLSVGDENFKRKAEQRMAEIVESTKILVLASHSPELILKTCNRVIWLEHGKIRMDGDPHSVVEAYFGAEVTA